MARDLLQAFEQASELFNASKYDELGKMFEHDVIMKRVEHPGSVVGIGNVLVYLNTHQKSQKPQFVNVNIQLQKEAMAATHGIVSGNATFKNNQGATIPIHFTFVFARNDPDREWLLVNLFAVPTN